MLTNSSNIQNTSTTTTSITATTTLNSEILIKPNCTIFAAARAGDIKALEWFVQTQKKSLHQKEATEEQASVLHLAAQYANLETVQWLVKHGADINAKTTLQNSDIIDFYKPKTKYANSIVDYAAYHHKGKSEEQRKKIEYLLSQGCQFSDEMSLFIYNQNREKILTTLNNSKEKKHNFNVYLYLATALGITEVVINLINSGLITEEQVKQNTLATAAENGHLETIKELIKEYSFFKHVHYSESLETAAENGHLHVMTWILENLKNISNNQCIQKAFITAAANDQLHVMIWLFKNHKDTLDLQTFYSANVDAAKQGHLHIMIWMYQKFESKDGNNKRAFSEASNNNHIPILKWLLVNTQTYADSKIRIAEMNTAIQKTPYEATAIYLQLRLLCEFPNKNIFELDLGNLQYQHTMTVQEWLDFFNEFSPLSIPLSIKRISTESQTTFIDALKVEECPKGLVIKFFSSHHTSNIFVSEEFKQTLKEYHQKSLYTAIVLIQGGRVQNSFLRLVPIEVRDIIYKFAGMQKYTDNVGIINPAKLFVKKYQPNAFFYPGYRSDESKKLGKDLLNILEKPITDVTPSEIITVIANFSKNFKKNEYIESAALAILLALHPTGIPEFEKHPTETSVFRLKN